MADTKISQMSNVSSLSGTEKIPIVQLGQNKAVTPAQLKSFVYANSANIWGYVDTYADIPLGTTSTDPEEGDLVGVLTTTGVWLLGTQRRMGFYRRKASTGNVSTDYGTSPYSGFQPEEFVPAGGTVGQVLSKSNNNDYETEWTDKTTQFWEIDGATDIKPLNNKTINSDNISGIVYGGLFQP